MILHVHHPNPHQNHQTDHKQHRQRRHTVAHAAGNLLHKTKGERTHHGRHLIRHVEKTEIGSRIGCVLWQQFGISAARQRLNATHYKTHSSCQDVKIGAGLHEIPDDADARPDDQHDHQGEFITFFTGYPGK